MPQPFFNYLSRTRDQMIADFEAIVPTVLPEITDVDDDVLVKAFGVFAGVGELLHQYIDNSARESNIESCRLFESAVMLARAEDYRVRSKRPFEVVLTFTLSSVAPSPVLIPKGTQVQTDAGLIYTTIANVTISTGATSATIVAKQMQVFEAQTLGVTNGTPNQTFIISDKLVDGSVVIEINAQIYTPVETFYYSLPNSTNFVQTVNPQSSNSIILGDGVNGKLPVVGKTVLATYQLTEGEEGKALAGELTDIVSTITLPVGVDIACNNLLDASGGTDRESIDQVRRNVKAMRATAETAVSRETYILLAYRVAGVAKAGVVYEFGATVDVYILPTGGGLATPALIADVEAYYETRKMILTTIRVNSAGEIRVLLEFNVTLLNNAVRTIVEQDIKDALVAFGSLDNQEIAGEMVSGTLDQIVCNVAGVKTCTLQVFSLVPYARPATGNNNELNWNVELLAGSTAQSKWRINFTTTSNFQLFKDDNFVNNYAINTPISLPEIAFEILQPYNAGDEWTFYAYPYLGNNSGSYQLAEPSILRIDESDITLNLTGGITI